MLSYGTPPAGPFVALVAMCCCFATCARAQTTSPSPEPQSVTSPPSNSNTSALSLGEALRLASVVASDYQIAILNEKVAAEDIKQAQAAFLPKVSAPLSYIYTSPALGLPPGEPRAPSYIANNAIG